MPKVKSLDELRKLREQVREEMVTRLETGTTITVGMGTCGIAAGARETMHAILEELRKLDIEAHVTTVGCIGMCANEPLVDIEQAGRPRITYKNLTADKVSRLIQEHLKNGNVVEEWVVGRISRDDE
ncbi:MAG TPA: (2Fe-2S) ferredoxin domain-containing protein [Chloroflexi bacterium]|jgi:NADP-reducing hydrogenase subunit HndB|nr:(2Fe-2S) ferredoxin domain-containing protein [Chloroflexota bacterium]